MQHTLLDELAEATLDGTRKERMEFLETVPLLIIDDLGMRRQSSLLDASGFRYRQCENVITPWWHV